MVVVPPEAGSERSLDGEAPWLAATDPLRCGALKLPRLQSRLARDLSRSATPLTLARGVVAAGVLVLILIGGLVHFRADTVEHRWPPSSADSIEAWLRHMTVTRAVPAPPVPGLSTFDWPEGL